MIFLNPPPPLLPPSPTVLRLTYHRQEKKTTSFSVVETIGPSPVGLHSQDGYLFSSLSLFFSVGIRARIFKLLRSQGVDSKEPILLAYVARRACTLYNDPIHIV
jgi:hypothetical protein